MNRKAPVIRVRWAHADPQALTAAVIPRTVSTYVEPTRTSPATRLPSSSGNCSANWRLAMPPIEWATTTTRSSPVQSSTALRSPARAWSE
jgi:hypothetical protein